jgi:hypothetical protein
VSRKVKITRKKLGEARVEERTMTTWRPNPKIYSLIKKRALKEDLSVREMLEVMAIFYLNEA